ncbi:hypothetical protein BD413DRAFT_37226 [Trametes elegans]|nr:hypothetical protein BD413DRAFT_37226 [Trametes elegans]
MVDVVCAFKCRRASIFDHRLCVAKRRAWRPIPVLAEASRGAVARSAGDHCPSVDAMRERRVSPAWSCLRAHCSQRRCVPQTNIEDNRRQNNGVSPKGGSPVCLAMRPRADKAVSIGIKPAHEAPCKRPADRCRPAPSATLEPSAGQPASHRVDLQRREARSRTADGPVRSPCQRCSGP